MYYGNQIVSKLRREASITLNFSNFFKNVVLLFLHEQTNLQVNSKHLISYIQAPGRTSKQNTKNISSMISSQQISGKNSESK